MSLAAIVPIVTALAQYAPAIWAFLRNNKEPKQTTAAVEAIAQEVTSAPTVIEALDVIKSDPRKAEEFRIRILEAENTLQIAYLQDMQSARDRDMLIIGQGQRNYRADILSALALIVIIALVVLIWQSPELNEYVKGVFTLVLGRFMGYIDNIYSFEFGSTRSSKQKDSTITHLSEK